MGVPRACLALLCLLALLCTSVMAAGEHSSGVGSNSTIEIEVIPSRRVTLEITVVDESDLPIPGVTVRLVDPKQSDRPPITGSDGQYVTGEDGTILIQLFGSAEQSYKIIVDYSGYDHYESESFQVTVDTQRLVKLRKTSTSPGETVYYDVYYHAGKGGSVGLDRERVAAGSSPRNVPVPVPEDGWRFFGWYLDGKAISAPSNLKIWRRTDLYAEFEEAAPLPTPTVSPFPSQSPSPTSPPSPTERPVPSSAPSHKPEPDTSPGSPPSGKPHPGAIENNGGTEDLGALAPTELPDEGNPPAESGATAPTPGPTPPTTGPGAVEGHTDDACWLHRLILLCAAVSAILCAGRLRWIKRRLKELDEAVQTDEDEKAGVY